MTTFNSCCNKFCKLNIIFQKYQSLSYLNDWGKHTATYYFIIVANSTERHEWIMLEEIRKIFKHVKMRFSVLLNFSSNILIRDFPSLVDMAT